MTTTHTTTPPAEGGCAVLLPIADLAPGWGSVQHQAVACGFTAKEETHLTVVFLGRDLSGAQCDRARYAVEQAMQEVRDIWERRKREGHGRMPNVPAFVPLRFPGTIGTFANKGGSHVHAVVEPTPALLTFREMIREHYAPYKVSADFGGYRPHVTLAEGPPGSKLAREAEVPEAQCSVHAVVLKLGKTREMLRF